MTMTETPATAPKPAKKRQPAKKRAAQAKPVAALPKRDTTFDGITPADCPMACTAERCVISGRGICAHPHKGGLQANMQNPDSMRRYNAAKRALGKRKLDIGADE
jgi:hypothetical protein